MINWEIENTNEDYIYTGYVGEIRTCLCIEKYTDENCWLFHNKQKVDGDGSVLSGEIEVLAKEVTFNKCKEIASELIDYK